MDTRIYNEGAIHIDNSQAMHVDANRADVLRLMNEFFNDKEKETNDTESKAKEENMELEDFTNEQLIKELTKRNYDVREVDDDSDEYGPMEIEDFSDDELINELGDRGYDIYKEDGECASDPMKDPYYKEEHLPREYVIPRSFDKHQLRAHLVDITGLGSYVSDTELTDELKRLLEAV